VWFPPVYKFMNRKYVRSFLKGGTIKIGTSKEYRVPDGKDGGRSDAEELVSVWTPAAGTIEAAHEHPFFRSLIPQPAGQTQFAVKFDEGVKIRSNANAFVFSTSGEYTEEIARRMASDFEADECVCISDPRAFGRALSKLPQFKGANVHIGYVEYGNTNEFTDYEPVNIFRKLTGFAWQMELRIVVPCQEEDESFVVDVPEIVPLLSRVR
jgi:hypothetical protein